MNNKTNNTINKILRLSPLFLLMLFILVIVCIDASVLSLEKIELILIQSSALMILSFAQMIVLTSGNMDMSGAYGVTFVIYIFGYIIMETGSFALAAFSAVGIGIMVGLFNGIFVGIFKIPSFFVTIATMSVLQGLALLFSTGRMVLIRNPVTKYLSAGRVFGVIPMPILCVAVIAVLVMLLMRYTRFGTNVYALGSNIRAAEVNGVSIARMQIKVFIISGVLMALSAIMLAARVSMVVSGIGGSTFLLEAVTATIIGGTSSYGGRGNVWGTLVGAIIVGMLSYVITSFGIVATNVEMLKGAVVVFALVFEILMERAGIKTEQKAA